jgi:hypothetical protein
MVGYGADARIAEGQGEHAIQPTVLTLRGDPALSSIVGWREQRAQNSTGSPVPDSFNRLVFESDWFSGSRLRARRWMRSCPGGDAFCLKGEGRVELPRKWVCNELHNA